MLKTEYYEVTRLRKASARLLENMGKEVKLVLNGEDDYKFCLDVLRFTKSFLGRFKCSIDAVEFFEKYADIRADILKAIEDPENASPSSSLLASTEFGKIICDCASQFDIIGMEIKLLECDYVGARVDHNSPMMYNPFSIFGQLNNIPQNPFSIENYGKPYVNKE